jgi:flagellum-specific peptidoglycan hydrolase FlgJ
MVDKFGFLVGMGGLNLSAQFRDLSDNAEDLKKSNEDVVKAAKDEVAAKADVAALAKIQSDAASKPEAERDKFIHAEIDKRDREKANALIAQEDELRKAYFAETDMKKKNILNIELQNAIIEKNHILGAMDNAFTKGNAKERLERTILAQKKAQADAYDRITEKEKELIKLKEENTKLGGTEVAKATEKGKVTPFTGTEKEFYDKMYTGLLEQATKKGVANPEAIARLGAAQSSLETGYGKHTPGGNNYFGIKDTSKNSDGSEVSTQEWDAQKMKMVTIKAKFKKFATESEGMAGYVDFLIKNKRYKNVLDAKTVPEAIAAQGATGYATDPDYATKLTNINAKQSVQPNPTVAQQASALPKADTGGVFSGPSGGYPVMLHGPGNEFVFKEHQLKTFVESVQKSTLESQLGSLTNPQSTSGVSSNEDIKSIVAMLGDKFDDLLNEMRNGNNIQDKVLSALA